MQRRCRVAAAPCGWGLASGSLAGLRESDGQAGKQPSRQKLRVSQNNIRCCLVAEVVKRHLPCCMCPATFWPASLQCPTSFLCTTTSAGVGAPAGLQGSGDLHLQRLKGQHGVPHQRDDGNRHRWGPGQGWRSRSSGGAHSTSCLETKWMSELAEKPRCQHSGVLQLNCANQVPQRQAWKPPRFR